MSFKRRFPTSVLLAVPLLVWPVAAISQAAQSGADAIDYAVFKDPPAQYRGHAMLGFGLANLTEERAASTVRDLVKNGYGGFSPLTGGTADTPYLSDRYFTLYKMILDEAKKNDLAVVVYDDSACPTGCLGGQFYLKAPQHAAKSLDMVEKNVTGPAKAELAIPEGVYVGAVMMNRDTFQLIDVSNRKGQNSGLVCQVPKGNWKVMAFYLKAIRVQTGHGGGAGSVDYLDEAAMDTFISLSYDKYYSHFKEYFGNVIKMFYYDEPTMHNADGRLWTPSFNQNFEKKYGYSPMKYYPALWYDIGPETAAARNALYGFRAQLYADNLVKKLNQWCDDHGIQLTGHQEQEENVSPVPNSGDLMKVFENQDTPGVDDIWWWGRSNRGYKIVSSAAANYDKPVVMGETYLAYHDLDDKIALRVAMDQYAMGVNFQIPGPDPKRRPGAAELNRFVGRMSYLLQHGRHVADIAVLYPIASLQAAYKFVGGHQSASQAEGPPPQIMSEAYAREGGVPPGDLDYIDVGEVLYRGLRVDYTYLHPEVLESRCIIDKQKLVLNNKENREEYSVLIVPGGNTLSAAAAKKLKEFYDGGGTVIATSELPHLSAEFGRDKEVQQAIAEVFGIPVDDPVTADVRRVTSGAQNFYVYFYFVHRNKAGGQAFFLPRGEPWLLNTVLKQVLPVRDVDIQEPMWLLKKGPDYDGALSYIHKVKNGRDIYFFANSSDRLVDTHVILRGKKDLTIWNPHSGAREQAPSGHSEVAGQPVTTVHLVLSPVSSLCYIGDE
jgi:hypothetical protein